MYGAVADLNGTILHELHIARHASEGEETFRILKEAITTLMDFSRQAHLPLRGVGIGVPGVVEDGTVTLCPALGWNNFSLAKRLEAEFDLPLWVENDANLAALGEFAFGENPAIRSLLLLAIGTGIGAGVVLNGEVYGGSHGLAGEIGYFLADHADLGKRYPDFGALELRASGSGIEMQAARLLAESGDVRRAQSAEVFSAADQGEGWAIKLLEQAYDALAQAIAAMTLCYDPDLILLGGGVASQAKVLLPAIKQRLEPALPLLPPIQSARFGFRAAVLGAVDLALGG